MRRLKGFVGPLGDDLPSIFPIVAAVLLFGATLFHANQLVDQKNKELGLRQGVLSLSYLVTEKGLLDDRADFKNRLCEDQLKKQGQSLRVHFLITIKKYCQKVEFYTAGVSPPYASPYFLEETLERGGASAQGHTFAYCTNQYKDNRLWDLKRNQAVTTPDFPVPEDAVTLVYPIGVPCESGGFPTNGMGLVFVTGWR